MPWRRQSEREEIVHIVVTGYQKKTSPRKHYVFVIDVTWNNNERYEVIRRYSEFFSFQTMLKALFPSEAGRRSEERSIPALPKRIFVGRSHVARVAEARLEHINRYCQNLISLEPKISESAHVIGFFSPRIGDKQLPRLHLQRPLSLYPQITPAGSLFEEYVTLADYQGDDDSQVSFKPGNKVMVVSKDPSGWWLCECKDSVGWAPPSYLKKCEDDGDSDQEEFLGLPESYKDTERRLEDGKDSAEDSGVGSPSPCDSDKPGSTFRIRQIEVDNYKALDSYEAEGPGQVSFREGDTIHVLDKMEDGWWFVSNGYEEGWAPCSYLENLSGEGDEDDTISSSLDIERYVTVDSYTAEEKDELSFPRGVVVEVLQKSLDGWWLVKQAGKTGLAPATYLKLIDDQTHSHSPNVQRKISPPSTQHPMFPIKKFQQPPRKQSVRIRVNSKKQKQSKLTTDLLHDASSALSNGNTTSALLVPRQHILTIPECDEEEDEGEHSYENTASWVSENSESSKFKLSSLTSPGSSDSEDQVPIPPRSPRAKKAIQSRINRFEQRSGSESSSLSEEGSPVTKAKKPQALPRSGNKPPALPKPKPSKVKEFVKSKSLDDGLTANRKLPIIEEPRSAALPATVCTPPRPRASEIRRAHQRASPVLSSDSSAFRPIRQRRSPSTSPIPSPGFRSRSPYYESGGESDAPLSVSPNLKPPANRIRSISTSPPPPVKPQRPRAVSTDSEAASNPFSQQMAETMIKYILASSDPTLRAALKDIVTSDPNVMSKISHT